jgi:hypothetical protein
MTAPLKKTPPPPPIAINDPIFNRWLHDLTAFIQEGGGIDTGNIPGYDTLVSQVSTNTSNIATNTSNITANSANIATNTANIATNTTNIATNTANIATNTSNIATLTARSQVRHGTVAPTAGLGVDGDWYSDTSAKHIYVRVTGSWVLIV